MLSSPSAKSEPNQELQSYLDEKENIEDLGYCPAYKTFFHACCYALPILHPYSISRLFWDGFILCALLYTAIEIPLTLAFEVQLSLNNTLGIIAFSIDIILLLDIIVNFRTRYYDKWDHLLLHTDPFDIAKKYINGWFWLDFLTSLPLEFIVYPDSNKSSRFAVYIRVLRIFRLFRILKILRMIRVMKMFDGLTKMMDIAREMFFVFKLCKIMAAMILTAHFFACIWWSVGLNAYKELIPPETNDDGVTIYSSWIQAQGIDPIHDSLFVKYSASWYWSIVTLFTTGYGDITAHNTTEQWVCSFCILSGSCAYAYLIGTLTSWVAEGDRVRCFEIQKLEEAQAFCRHYKFSRSLTRMILTHVRYYCNYNFVLDSDDILSVLPPFLQRKVNDKLAKRTLSKMELFRHLPKEVIGQIALSMRSVSCNANRYLFKRGDVALCLYIQRTGKAKLKYNDGTPSRRLTRGDVVGERALIGGKRRNDCKVMLWSEFFVLDVESIRCIFRRNFKPKRCKHEWNLLKRKVRMDETRRVKTIRKCYMMPRNDTHPELIHDLSQRATTLRSEIMGVKLSKTDKTDSIASIKVKDRNKYEKVPPDDNVSDEIVNHTNEINESCSLDLDHLDKQPPDWSQTTSTGNQSRNAMLAIYPFIVRRNSEIRNAKVMSDTADTAFFQKADTAFSMKTSRGEIMELEGSESDQLDLDDTTDSEQLMGSEQYINAPVNRKSSALNLNKKKIGKFGKRRRKSMDKTKMKFQSHMNGMKNVSPINRNAIKEFYYSQDREEDTFVDQETNIQKPDALKTNDVMKSYKRTKSENENQSDKSKKNEMEKDLTQKLKKDTNC